MVFGNEEVVLLEHGSGGKASQRLLEEIFFPLLEHVCPLDSALLEPPVEQHRLAFTTDTFVVDPIFFPGGDIGSLAVHGTVNDLAMVGARPFYLSVAFVLEEGLALETLRRIVKSLSEAAQAADVRVVCGDTKVVPRGKGDKVFINTSGIGWVSKDVDLQPQCIKPGDKIIISGPVGEHGLAILASREGLGLEGLKSDSQAVHRPALALVEELGPALHALRDPTRGGLASALNELALAAGHSFFLEETKIPLRPEVESGCEILGLDPLYLACEGRFIAFVEASAASKALEVLSRFPSTRQASLAGEVLPGEPKVWLKTRAGGTRLVPSLAGEPLPRIC